jgi:hypothetical protein
MILTLALILVMFPDNYHTRLASIVLIFAVFLVIVYGNNLFGVLTTTAAKYIGTVSYSIYLLHGIVLFITFNITNRLYPIKQMSPLSFWLLSGVAGLIVICLSGITFRFIEYPFMMWKFRSPSSSTPIS